MTRAQLRIFFAFLFLVSLTAPSVVTLLDKYGDNGIVYNVIDQESETDENECKKQIEYEYECFEFVSRAIEQIPQVASIDAYYWSMTFDELHLDGLSPPPKYI